MSIDISGRDRKVASAPVTISIPENHPLVLLAAILPWALLMDLVVQDLKKTTAKGCWWLGRKIKVRVHLGAFLLSKLYNLSDRKLEYGLRDNAAYRLFCGCNIISEWHAPDHTKIEEFRSRLSPETQRTIANEISKAAVALGFADPQETDFDSTVQQANIAYPSDASLLTKLVQMGRKVIDFVKQKITRIPQKSLVEVNLKKAKEYARKYFFQPRNTNIERRRKVFKDLYTFVKKQMLPVIDICNQLTENEVAGMPWNISQTFHQIHEKALRYLKDVAHFIRNHTIKPGKILSFHAREVSCIKKGKPGKEMEFGRIFQLGRIKGNFLFIGPPTPPRNADRNSLIPLVSEHASLFGEGTLKSVAADKGYWKKSNQEQLIKCGLKEIGIQRPSNVKSPVGLPTQEVQDRLKDRRAGIEPLIGHAKHGGQLGKSRMKSDSATLAAGYSSILGLNLRQLIRHQAGKIKLAV